MGKRERERESKRKRERKEKPIDRITEKKLA